MYLDIMINSINTTWSTSKQIKSSKKQIESGTTKVETEKYKESWLITYVHG